LLQWGNRQLVPEWEMPKCPNGRRIRKGLLVDLERPLVVNVQVLEIPNQLVALAIHGTGITCVLLNRSDNALELASKVGMVNLPPYILAQTFQSGSVYV
ncbi:hypothetical protein M422DRAFT_129897, partial [Sphaerobolus stellatus SS14]